MRVTRAAFSTARFDACEQAGARSALCVGHLPQPAKSTVLERGMASERHADDICAHSFVIARQKQANVMCLQ